MKILAIDPGPTESGFVVLDGSRIVMGGVEKNEYLIDRLHTIEDCDLLAIEMIANYGMAVGKDVFETCVWIGRFLQEWEGFCRRPAKQVYRKDVKMHLCQTPRAKDANIRQALIDMLGPIGTKANPGPLYGVKSHAWAAAAVAITARDNP